MYTERLKNNLYPILGTLRDNIAFSLPIPQRDGLAVAFFSLKKDGEMKKLQIEKICIFSQDMTLKRTIQNTEMEQSIFKVIGTSAVTASFPDIYKQKIKCYDLLEGLLDRVSYEQMGFLGFVNTEMDDLRRMVHEIQELAQMEGLQALYDLLLTDLTAIIQ